MQLKNLILIFFFLIDHCALMAMTMLEKEVLSGNEYKANFQSKSTVKKVNQQLLAALLANDLQDVRIALKNNANPNALFQAIKKYDEGITSTYCFYRGLSTALEIAIRRCSLEIIQTLLDSGAHVDSYNRNHL